MKKYRLAIDPYCREDVYAIRDAFLNRGIDIPPADIFAAYGFWSEDAYCAGWVCLAKPVRDSLLDELLKYMKEVPEGAGIAGQGVPDASD